MAEPGGICISGSAYDQVETKLTIGFQDIGPQAVKNIDKPVAAYRLVPGSEAAPTKPSARSRRMPAIAAAVVLLALGAGGYWAWDNSRLPTVEAASLKKMAFPLPTEPSIAVLPFNNLTGDADQDIMIDGLVEEIITSLSKVPNLFVVARNSTFSYKGKAVKVSQVAEELGVRYVLEGSVRGSGDNARFTAQLIDAVAGHHLWAESYDREIKDILDLQSEIALQIVTELDVELVSGEWARLQRRTTSSPEAYEIFLRARAHTGGGKEGLVAKIRMYEQAIELDPNFAAAWANLADRTAGMGRQGYVDMDPAYAEGERLARKAIALDDTFSGAYLALSTIHRWRGEFDESLALVEKALARAPNDAEANLFKGRMARLAPGRAEEAIPVIKKAMRLNPHYPLNYLNQLGWAYLAAGQYQEAHEVYLEYALRRPNSHGPHMRLAMTYSLLDQPEKARAEAAESLRIRPERTIAQHIKLAPYRDSNPALIKLEVDAMRAAGFPEE